MLILIYFSFHRLFEEAVELLMNLDSFLAIQLVIFLKSTRMSLMGGRSLHFQVEDHGDFYELIITEPQVKVVESAVYPAWNGVFYHLTPQQRILWKAIQRLTNGPRSKNACIFDPTDQTKASSYSLKEFKKLGQITAPTSFFNPRFHSEFHLI